jgi:integrase
MSVRLTPYKGNRWLADVRVRLASGEKHRERKVISARSKTAARRWAEQREHYLLEHGPTLEAKEVPTFEQFAPRFLDGHARANRQKPSGIASKEAILRLHLLPFLATKKLDAISTEHIQQLKSRLTERSPKTVNNVLAVLSVMLKKAVEWGLIERMPCSIRLLRVLKSGAGFHDFADYERLIETATGLDSGMRLVVLLGGEAGLRCGEMIALEWGDVDFNKRQLCVQRSDWKGQVGSPKGGRLRYVPLTNRLSTALREHRHLRSQRVLCEIDGTPLTRQRVQYRLKRIAKHANVREGVHRLRHTFCSHLAMKGAPARAIQELAGHSDLGTTQRYMHLSPTALDAAIRLLDGSPANSGWGNSGATGQAEASKASG